MLTNGIEWRLFKVCFKKPIDKQEIAAFNLLTANTKNEDDMEKNFTRRPLWYCLRIAGSPQLQH